jgi:hypothetical protein
MWIRSKKTILAIEWVWLLIGAGVVFAHLVEAWASPYLPALWMLGVLGLFFAYRLGIAAREVYWPEPEVEHHSEVAAARRGGDGRVSTTEWVPPHIRGRQNQKRQVRGDSAPAVANQAALKTADSDQTAEQLELPSASGHFAGADIVTVFAEVDEDTNPRPTAIVDVGIPFHSTAIVRIDKADLRPETEADMSQEKLVIPSFAESALTGDERKRALEIDGDKEVTSTKSRPEPPAAPEDETNPIRVKDTPTRSGGKESK